ncbi:MAG: CvpA family protein [Elusimicrobiota bacterium]
MTLDLWIVAALGLFAAIGYYTGAIQQLSHLIGIVAAFLCAKPLAAALAPVLAERMGWPPSLTGIGLSAVSMPILLIIATLLSRGILNAIIPGDQRNKPDRIAGIFLGAGKAGVIVWAMLSVVIGFEKSKAVPDMVKDALSVSSAAAYTREHGLFAAASPSALEKLQALAALRDDPEQAKALLENPALKSLFSDPAVKQALEKGDASALLENPRLKKLLEDPELAKKLEAMKAR